MTSEAVLRSRLVEQVGAASVEEMGCGAIP
jgi:hypothetical protein